MSNVNDFVIEDGVLSKYTGTERNVVIPDSVTSIGFSAFSGCYRLTSVKMSSSVTSIEQSAFANCEGLTQVKIPDSVTSVGAYAFKGCQNLTGIEIPASVTSIGGSAFEYCLLLTHITVDKNNAYYSNDESGVLFNKDKTQLIRYPAGNVAAAYIIPDSVTSIGGSAFEYCKNLTQIEIPDSVISIGYEAFSGCISLTQIEIPDSVTSIGFSAFSGCESITKVEIPNGVTSIENRVFQWCKNLTQIEIPDGVTSIGEWAFYGCKHLTRIEIPDSVTSIESDAFCDCENLVSLINPVTIANINSNVLSGREKMENVRNSSDDKFKLVDNCLLNKKENQLYYLDLSGKEADILILATVEVIKGGAMSSRYSYKAINVPGSVRKIEKNAIVVPLAEVVYLPRTIEKISAGAVEAKNVVCYSVDCIGKFTGNIIYAGGEIEDIPSKFKPSAVQGFIYAICHGIEEINEYRDCYIAYIKKNKKTYIERCYKDADLFKFMTEEKIINEEEAEKMMKYYVENNDTEYASMLLNYIATIRKTGETEKFDIDKGIKTIEKKIAHQEEISKQKGIKNIAFVATGSMMNFGAYDEYTGAHDLSDLKKFIEEKGGFLRSAVSGKTDYLICNNRSEMTTKLKKALELGVEIITEDEFLKMASEE